MKNRDLLIVGIVALALIFLSKKRAFESLEIRPAFPRNFKLSGLTNVSFDLPFTAFNGSNGTLNIGGIDLRVYAENQYIGRALAAQNQQILPFGQSILTTQVFVNLVDMATAIPGFLSGAQDQAVSLLFRGTLNVEGIYVPFETSLNFNLPKLK